MTSFVRRHPEGPAVSSDADVERVDYRPLSDLPLSISIESAFEGPPTVHFHSVTRAAISCRSSPSLRVQHDTHALLWWLDGDARLSARAQAAILEPAQSVLVSPRRPGRSRRSIALESFPARKRLRRMCVDASRDRALTSSPSRFQTRSGQAGYRDRTATRSIGC